MRKNRKKKKSIYTKLVISFFLFSAVAILVIFVFSFLELIILGSGDINQVAPYGLIKEDGSLGPLEGIYSAHGWVEKLDENYQIIEVFGEKKTEGDSYTERELLEITRMDDASLEYRTVWEPIEGGSYLFCYPKDVVSIQMTFEMSEMETSLLEKTVWAMMYALLIVDGALSAGIFTVRYVNR